MSGFWDRVDDMEADAVAYGDLLADEAEDFDPAIACAAFILALAKVARGKPAGLRVHLGQCMADTGAAMRDAALQSVTRQ